MFGFLKAYFARPRAFGAEIVERERARVATLTKQHLSGAKAYVAEHLPPTPPPKPKVVKEASSREGAMRYSVSAKNLEPQGRSETLYKVRARKPDTSDSKDNVRHCVQAGVRFSIESLYDGANHLPKPKKTFVEKLHEYLRASSCSNAEIYKAAQIDRRLFSKMISDVKYKPSRDVAIALGLALHLSLSNLKDFLGRAGYALSKSSRRDLIIEYFFTERCYDLIVLNSVLHDLNEEILATSRRN